LARLALLDHVGVLGESAGVKEKRDAVPTADGAHLAKIFQAHRLTAAAVVRHRDHTHRHVRRANLVDQPLQLAHVQIPLKGVPTARLCALVNDQVHGPGAGVLDVGSGCVEVVIVGDDLSRPAY
jgi:hypothetical protein